jgi:hypothetical protein
MKSCQDDWLSSWKSRASARMGMAHCELETARQWLDPCYRRAVGTCDRRPGPRTCAGVLSPRRPAGRLALMARRHRGQIRGRGPVHLADDRPVAGSIVVSPESGCSSFGRFQGACSAADAALGVTQNACPGGSSGFSLGRNIRLPRAHNPRSQVTVAIMKARGI